MVIKENISDGGKDYYDHLGSSRLHIYGPRWLQTPSHEELMRNLESALRLSGCARGSCYLWSFILCIKQFGGLDSSFK